MYMRRSFAPSILVKEMEDGALMAVGLVPAPPPPPEQKQKGELHSEVHQQEYTRDKKHS